MKNNFINNMTSNTKVNLYWNTLLRIPVKVISFIVSIYVARLLDPEDFGVMAIVMMSIGYANLLTGFGLSDAIVQRTINCNKTINSIFVFNLIISVFMVILFVFISRFISDFFGESRVEDVIKIMSIYFITSTFFGISHAIIRKNMEFKKLATIDSMQVLSMSFITVIFAMNNYGYWSLAWGQIIPMFIFSIYICFSARWLPKFYFSIELIRPIFNFGIWSFLRNQISFLINHIDQILIGRVIGSHSLGIYDKSMSISKMPGDLLLVNINSVMFSSFSLDKDKPDVLLSKLEKSLMITGLIVSPVYVGLVSIAPYFVEILLGLKWLEMVLPFKIICIAFVFKSYGGIFSSFNIAIGKYKEFTIRLFISGLIFFVSCLALINFGMVGVAISFLIFSLAEFSLYVSLTCDYLKISVYELVKPILICKFYSILMFTAGVSLSVFILDEITITNMLLLIGLQATLYLLLVGISKDKILVSVKEAILSDVGGVLSKFIKKS
jgi:O-antigen/teichoic acid export membrane protein